MLFSKGKEKEKNGQFVLNTSQTIEEETVRRWRDIAAQRSQRNLFDDSEEDLTYPSPHTVAAQWPSSQPEHEPGGHEFSNGYGAPFSDTEYSEETAGAFDPDLPLQPVKTIELEQCLAADEPDLMHDAEDELDDEAPAALSQEQLIGRPEQLMGRSDTRTHPLNAMKAAEPTAIKETVVMQAQPYSPTPLPAAEPMNTRANTILCDLSLPIEQDLKRRFGTNIKSALGPGTVIEGTFRFDSPVCVDGTLTGEITSTSALIVGSEASINGTIKVGSLIIMGTVNGSVDATELVEIRRGGMLDGDITTERIVIEDGGWFEGRVVMTEKK